MLYKPLLSLVMPG